MSVCFFRVANKVGCYSHSNLYLFVCFFYMWQNKVTGIVNTLTWLMVPKWLMLLTWLKCSVLQTSSGVTVNTVKTV